MSDEDHAIEMMLDDFRMKVVEHDNKLRIQASRAANLAARSGQDEAMKAQRDTVTVTIE